MKRPQKTSRKSDRTNDRDKSPKGRSRGPASGTGRSREDRAGGRDDKPAFSNRGADGRFRSNDDRDARGGSRSTGSAGRGSRTPDRGSSRSSDRPFGERSTGRDSFSAGRGDRDNKKPFQSRDDRGSVGGEDKPKGRTRYIRDEDRKTGPGSRGGARTSGSREERPARGYSDRGDDRPTSDRRGSYSRNFNKDENTGRDERPTRSRDDKPFGDRPTRSRDDKPFSDRPTRSRDDKPFGDRPTRSRDDKPFGDRTTRSRDDKPFGDRPTRSRDDKPFGDRTTRNRDDKPFGDRPSRGRDDKPFGDRPSRGRDDKPFGDRPTRSRDDKPFGDRPTRSRDDKPFGDRPTRSRDDKPFGDRPASRGSRDSFDKGERKPYSKRTSKYSEGPARRPRVRYEDGELPPLPKEIRLNRFIGMAGICSRREADGLILAGVISVNGEVATELGMKVKPGDDVRYNGERIRNEKPVYLLLNKPKDYITTADDPEGRKTVMELVASACDERIYPIGRLDRNTTGLLMFTNDGDLARFLTHPSSKVKKIYGVELDKNFKVADMQKVREGLTLEDGKIEVDQIDYDEDGLDKKKVGIEIHSGKNRIVRRIFEHLGYEVKKLDRVIFAGLTKKDLPRGRWRFLNEAEVNMMKVTTGAGKKRVKKAPKVEYED